VIKYLTNLTIFDIGLNFILNEWIKNSTKPICIKNKWSMDDEFIF